MTKTFPYSDNPKWLTNLCLQIIQRTPEGERADIAIPTDEPKNTKKNRVRFCREDNKSPLGLVIRGDAYVDNEWPTVSCARFDCVELVSWLIRNTVIGDADEQ